MIGLINFFFLIKSMSYDDVHYMASNWKVNSNIVFKENSILNFLNAERNKVTAVVPPD